MVDLHHVIQLHEQHLTAAIAVDGDRDTLLPVGKVDEFLLDVPEPSALMAFFTPQLRRFRTSFRPSTMMSEDEDSTLGPQVNPWKDLAVPTVKTERTSSMTVLEAASPEFTMVSNNSLARPPQPCASLHECR